MKNRLTMNRGETKVKLAWGLLLVLGVLMSSASFAMNKAPPPDYGDLIAGRFRVVEGSDGAILRDTQTGLEWQRCPAGMQWSHSSCVGTHQVYNWDSAKDLTAPGGFRTPTIDELKTLIQIDHQLFPGSAGWFWSSSPYGDLGAMYVYFVTGAANYGFRTLGLRVRLVRVGQ
jgi:hypothetical protein